MGCLTFNYRFKGGRLVTPFGSYFFMVDLTHAMILNLAYFNLVFLASSNSVCDSSSPGASGAGEGDA